MDLIRNHVYVVATKRFVNLTTLRELDREQFNAAFAAEMPEDEHGRRESASWSFLKRRRGRRVHTVTYVPGGARFVPDPKGGQALNIYSPSRLKPSKGDVGPWLQHLRLLIPDGEAREHVLDWCAVLLQKPQVKVNHGLLIQGQQGIGKDSLFRPVLDAVGPQNVATIGPQHLDDGGQFNEWLYGAKVVVVEEIRALHDRALANRLKPYLASPPELISVNRKFTPMFYVPNIAAFLFFSNVEAPIALADDDRRLFVYRSPATKQPADYYTRYHRWCDKHAGDVYDYLLRRDISKFNPAAHPPMTESKRELIEASRSPLYQYLQEVLEAQQYPLEGDLVSINDLAAQLPPRLGRPSNHRIGATLAELGAVDLGSIRFSEGERTRKRRLWAVRRGPFLLQQTERKIAALYTQQQERRPGARLPDRVGGVR